MGDALLFRILGASAIAGGLVRLAAVVIPYSEEPWLMWLYLSIDVFLLFGLMGIYFANRARVGVFGLIGFGIAEAGIASIVGPDAIVNGFNTYMVGVFIIGIGMMLFGIAMLIGRASPYAPMCWILATVVGAAMAPSGDPDLGFAISGALFGLGFVVAGSTLWLGVEPAGTDSA